MRLNWAPLFIPVILAMKLTAAFLVALTCAALPAWAVPVSVIVVGPDDKPLPQANLKIVDGKYPLQPDIQPRAVAGADGRFTFDWDGAFPAKDAKVNIEDRRFLWARIEAPGMATQAWRLTQPATTIHLQTGRSFGGIVTDAAQKPVAGVKIELTGWTAKTPDAAPDAATKADNGEAAPEQAMFAPIVDAWKSSAVTDAAGHWQFDDLPAQVNARFKISDARFITQSFSFNLDAKEAPPLFVKPGATLTGVVLKLDGTPLADAPVGVGWGGDNRTRTDAQGRFTLTGVEPGDVSLRSNSDFGERDKTPDYLLPTLDKVRAVAGETTDVGQWKAVAGLVLTAKLVDEKTKKPIEGARLNFWNGGGGLMNSDAQGQITGRVLPDNLREGGQTIGSTDADGYVQTQIARPVFDKDKDAAIDLGTIELARGTAMRGTVRVEGEDGKTIANAPNLTLINGGDSAWINLWRGQADFTTQALKPGNYTVNLDGNRSAKNKDWEVVSPASVTVPAPTENGEKDEKTAPIEIVLRRLTPATPLLGLVSGRVTDADGKGIGGATVRASLRAGNTYTRAEVLSQNDGSFQIERSDPRSVSYFAADTVEIKSIERPGYYWASQPQIETKGGATTIGNLMMKKRGAIFASRVLDANGKGAAGAWVAVLEARDYPLVQADAEGRFELVDLPVEKFSLIGADGAGFGRAQTEANATGFELSLAPNPTADREALATRALEGKVDFYNAQGYWDILGTARIADLLEREGDKNQRNWGVTQFAGQLAKRDPAEFARRAPALIALADDGERPALEAKLFALRAASDEADDRIAANAWLDEQKMVKREINDDSVTQLLQMAVVAHKLKREDAASWLDYGAAIAAQLKAGGEGQSGVWGSALAQIGAEAMTPFVEEMKPPVEFSFWQGASVALARNGDLAGAKAALARMEELGQTPELIERGKKQQWDNPAAQLDRARQSVAVALAATDAAGALEMVPATGQEWDRINNLLLIADRAIQSKDGATAEKVLRQAMQMRSGNAEKFALAASLAQQLDPKLGAEMWADALKRTVPDKADDFGGYRPSVGMWAFYHANLDAGQSRVLLEREWDWRLPAAVKTKDEEYSSDGYILSQLEIGMAAVDPARALEMRDEARAKAGKADAATKGDIGLAAAILATPAQRARFGVDEQS